jgi:hypothetical protein
VSAGTGGAGVVQIGPRVLIALVAGRGLYRLSVLAAALLLIDAWTAPAFARYAAAMGAYAFVLPVVASGVEKSALRLLPPAAGRRPALVACFLLTGCGLAAVFVAVLAVAHAAGWGIGSAELAVGVLAALLAVNQMLVGLQRALGRPLLDVADSIALAVATVGATAPALVAGAGLLTYVLSLSAVVGILDVLLLAALRPWARPRPELAQTVRTTALMGVADVAGGVATAALFVILAHSAHEQTAPFYVTTSVAALAFGVVEYVMRVLQPQVSLALARRPATARRRARRLGLAIVAGGSAYLAIAFGVAVAMADITARPLGLASWAPAVALLVACLPVFLATAILNYVLENVDAASLRRTAAGSAAGLAAAVAAGLLLAPRWGAFGAVAALTIGEVGHAAAVLVQASPAGRRLASRWRLVRRKRAVGW